jgi:hypothetical protein
MSNTYGARPPLPYPAQGPVGGGINNTLPAPGSVVPPVPGASATPGGAGEQRDRLAAAVMGHGTMGGPLDAPMAGIAPPGVAPPGGMGSQTQPQPPMPSSFPGAGSFPQAQPAATGAANPTIGPMGPVPGPGALPLPGVPQPGMPLPVSPNRGY